MTSPPTRSASAIPNSLLPEAVGPTTAMIGCVVWVSVLTRRGRAGGRQAQARRRSAAPARQRVVCGRIASVKLRDADAGVERLQNLFVRESGAGEAVSADLTHPDAVPPAASVEDELRHAAALVERAVDDEKLLAQA